MAPGCEQPAMNHSEPCRLVVLYRALTDTCVEIISLCYLPTTRTSTACQLHPRLPKTCVILCTRTAMPHWATCPNRLCRPSQIPIIFQSLRSCHSYNSYMQENACSLPARAMRNSRYSCQLRAEKKKSSFPDLQGFRAQLRDGDPFHKKLLIKPCRLKMMRLFPKVKHLLYIYRFAIY